jgi:hypothetical protein
LAYKTIPMFWTGTAMLLVGVVLVAAVPGTVRRPAVAAAATPAETDDAAPEADDAAAEAEPEDETKAEDEDKPE